MGRAQLMIWTIVFGVALQAAAPGMAAGPPRVNRLAGVVLNEEGKPVAHAPVVMANREQGYVYFAPQGLQSHGQAEKVLGFFTKRNSKYACSATADREGRFSFDNFAAPDEPWIVVAGDDDHGYTLLVDVCPQDYADEPLTLTLTKPATVKTKVPKPPKKSMTMHVSTTLAPLKVEISGESGEGAAAEEIDLSEHVYFSQVGMSTNDDEPVELGPLPAGLDYHVVAYAWSPQSNYPAVMFVRVVTAEAGKTLDVELANKEGTTLSGKVTDTKDKPLADVNVTVKASDGMIVGALTNDKGEYELHGVPAGTHELALLRHAKRRVPG